MSSLEVDGLTVRFGGLTAVDEVSFSAAVGQITGLIGPNGAGKTTTFNCCSGLQSPTEGRIRFLGEDVTGKGPDARARRGLGRTFQRMQLWTSLTVRDNVALGAEAVLAGANPLLQLRARRGERRQTLDTADAAMEAVGIPSLGGARPGDLSTGQQRLVELARAIAGGHKLLLLDEPSSGLDKTETRRFGDVLLDFVRTTGAGVLLVEHDMSLVLRICDAITVLDFGKQIYCGTPAEVASSPVVRSAYLGTEEVA
jgi:ABC-type branched-subunit amino acid transport system ATPase component